MEFASILRQERTIPRDEMEDFFSNVLAKFTNEVQENIFLKNKNKYFYVLLEVGNNFRSEVQRSYSDFQ